MTNRKWAFLVLGLVLLLGGGLLWSRRVEYKFLEGAEFMSTLIGQDGSGPQTTITIYKVPGSMLEVIQQVHSEIRSKGGKISGNKWIDGVNTIEVASDNIGRTFVSISTPRT